jgi:hypothetical protein
MKTLNLHLTVLIMLGALCIGVVAGADTVAAAPAVPDWVTSILGYLQSIPTVGPVITFILNFIATIATVFTMLTVFLTGACKTLSTLAAFAKLGPIAENIQAFHDKVQPYVAYFSIFNVQKPKS